MNLKNQDYWSAVIGLASAAEINLNVYLKTEQRLCLAPFCECVPRALKVSFQIQKRMDPSHLETNLLLLLGKCEELAEKEETGSWRFDKYVNTLQHLLNNLSKQSVKPPQETLKDFSRRIDFLKQISLMNAKKNELLTEVQAAEAPFKLANPGPIMTNKDVKPKQIFHKKQLNQDNILRNKLLGSSKSEDTKEGGHERVEAETADMKKILSEQKDTQEKLTNEMLRAVQGIKENTMLARTIIKSDNVTLGDMNTVADKNSDNLRVINDRLDERVSRSCNCWIWLMLMLILMVFIMMIIFMKLFPKRKYGYDYSSSAASSDQYAGTYTHFMNNKTIVVDNQTLHTIEL